MVTDNSVPIWVPFWLETNNAWGAVNNEEDWAKIRESWNAGNTQLKPEDIYRVNRSERSEVQQENTMQPRLPSFGSRGEHVGGDMTLGVFFDKNNMDRNVGA